MREWADLGPDNVVRVAHRQVKVKGEREAEDRDDHHCPGRKPQFLAAKRPARPYKNTCKNTIQNRFTQENAKGT
jgi:hypothetical protein